MVDDRKADQGREARVDERSHWRRDLVLMIALFCAVAGLYAWDQDREADQDAQDRAEIRAVIVDAIEANCTSDLRFREQYRIRAIAERQLFRIERRANEAIALVATAFTDGVDSLAVLETTLLELNRRLAEVEDTIKIIPIPACENLSMSIEEAINGQEQ